MNHPPTPWPLPHSRLGQFPRADQTIVSNEFHRLKESWSGLDHGPTLYLDGFSSTLDGSIYGPLLVG